MRSLTLAKSGLNKVRAHQKELKQNDIEDSIRSLTPGEWCRLDHPTLAKSYLCFVNPLLDERYASINVLEETAKNANTSVEEFISNKITAAFKNRERFNGYEVGARIFYGASDHLPGLIIDRFQDKAIIQINTAGIDKFRDFIKAKVDELIKGHSYFLDNQKYREKEFLPQFETENIPDLSISENGIKFFIRAEVMQKVGFYYDHRENRNQLMNLIGRLKNKPKKGIDLFCYAGAWGLSGLKAGVNEMHFVDQGDFHTEITSGLELNGFANQGQFVRADVFKYLDEQIKNAENFDLILCDPPAFAKSLSQKDQALDGYSKLHRKVLKLASPGAIIAFSSCTHYVNHDEFQKNILDAANKENKKVQLLYAGMQGWDHPVSSLNDRSNYIKSYFYILES